MLDLLPPGVLLPGGLRLLLHRSGRAAADRDDDPRDRAAGQRADRVLRPGRAGLGGVHHRQRGRRDPAGSTRRPVRPGADAVRRRGAVRDHDRPDGALHHRGLGAASPPPPRGAGRRLHRAGGRARAQPVGAPARRRVGAAHRVRGRGRHRRGRLRHRPGAGHLPLHAARAAVRAPRRAGGRDRRRPRARRAATHRATRPPARRDGAARADAVGGPGPAHARRDRAGQPVRRRGGRYGGARLGRRPPRRSPG